MNAVELLHVRAEQYHRRALALHLLQQSILNGDTDPDAAAVVLEALDEPDRRWEDLVDGPWKEEASLAVAKRLLCNS